MADNAPLPGGQATYMVPQERAPRRVSQGINTLAAGRLPMIADRERSPAQRWHPAAPSLSPEATSPPARGLRSPTPFWLAALHHPRAEAATTAEKALLQPVMRLTTGTPLQPTLRARLEPSLGFDLGGVRLHTDSTAASLAARLSAQAFTVGRQIFFAAGRFQPQTRQGVALLAHELAHVHQQPEGRPWPWGQLTATAHRALEQQADVQAQAALARVGQPAFGLSGPQRTPLSRPSEDAFAVAAAPNDAGLGLPPLVLSYASRALAVTPLRQPSTADSPDAPVPPMTTTPAAAPAAPAAEPLDPEQLAAQIYAWIQRRQRLEHERRGIQQWH